MRTIWPGVFSAAIGMVEDTSGAVFTAHSDTDIDGEWFTAFRWEDGDIGVKFARPVDPFINPGSRGNPRGCVVPHVSQNALLMKHGGTSDQNLLAWRWEHWGWGVKYADGPDFERSQAFIAMNAAGNVVTVMSFTTGYGFNQSLKAFTFDVETGYGTQYAQMEGYPTCWEGGTNNMYYQNWLTNDAGVHMGYYFGTSSSDPAPSEAAFRWTNDTDGWGVKYTDPSLWSGRILYDGDVRSDGIRLVYSNYTDPSPLRSRAWSNSTGYGTRYAAVEPSYGTIHRIQFFGSAPQSVLIAGGQLGHWSFDSGWGAELHQHTPPANARCMLVTTETSGDSYIVTNEDFFTAGVGGLLTYPFSEAEGYGEVRTIPINSLPSPAVRGLCRTFAPPEEE